MAERSNDLTYPGDCDVPLNDIRQAFELFDTDGDGRITLGDLYEVMRAVGETPAPGELEAMVGKADADGNGFVDFNEFIALMCQRIPGMDSDAQVRASFNIFDKDGDGYINLGELRTVMVSIGEHPSDEDLGILFAVADRDGDGRISYSEFHRLITA
jgi:calmodulin